MRRAVSGCDEGFSAPEGVGGEGGGLGDEVSRRLGRWWVVVDAKVVETERERWDEVGTEAAGAEEAVLDPGDGKVSRAGGGPGHEGFVLRPGAGGGAGGGSAKTGRGGCRRTGQGLRFQSRIPVITQPRASSR